MKLPTAVIMVGGRRKIVNANDPRVTGNAVQKEEKAETLTRDDIAKMKAVELRDLLASHGADTNGKVADLRSRLISCMFVDP